MNLVNPNDLTEEEYISYLATLYKNDRSKQKCRFTNQCLFGLSVLLHHAINILRPESNDSSSSTNMFEGDVTTSISSRKISESLNRFKNNDEKI